MMNNQKSTFIFFTIILFVSIFTLFNSNGQFDQLQNYYFECNYQKAINLAEVILQDPTLDKQKKVKIYVIKGVSEFSSNQVLDARKTFMELLLFDKDVTIDSKEVSPKIIDCFNEVKNKLVVNNI